MNLDWPHLDRAVEDYCGALSNGTTPSLHSVAAAVHELCATVEVCEHLGDRNDIVERLAPARALHARSPFIRRLQTWARGYPGDFETVETIVNQVAPSASGTVAYWLEYAALHSAIAQQHRNKISAQAEVLLSALRSRTDSRPPLENPPSIAVLACGSSPDLRRIERRLAEFPCRIVLNDADTDALEHSLRHLPLLRQRIEAVGGDVFSSLKEIAQHGPYDLVLTGGCSTTSPTRRGPFSFELSVDACSSLVVGSSSLTSLGRTHGGSGPPAAPTGS